MANKNYYTVHEFNSYIKNIFDYEELLHNVPIMGEVSGCSVVSSHCYFTLKDEYSQISVVCFDCKRTYIPKNGEQVLVIGRPDFYIKGGKLSINARIIQPFGIGKLLEQLDKLKEKLSNEGLFDKDKKKIIPLFPNNIAIITSSKGAALQDILSTIYKKNTQQKITVIDVRVQGENASLDMIKAINGADKLNFDVIVIARGGGSFEDLFVFNDENLVRTIYNANTPIISAVGHETDYTLCDAVADERAITPTAAGDRLGYDILTLSTYIKEIMDKIKFKIESMFELTSNKIFRSINEINNGWRNLFLHQLYIIKSICGRMKLVIENKIKNEDYKIAAAMQAIETLSPIKLMQKGYFRLLKENEQISQIAQLELDDVVEIFAYDGKAQAIIKNKENFLI